jgi:hypothetical protein
MIILFIIYLFTIISTVDGFGLIKRPCKNPEPCFYPTLVAYSVACEPVPSAEPERVAGLGSRACTRIQKRARGLFGAHVSGRVGAFWGELLLHVFFPRYGEPCRSQIPDQKY